MPGLRFRFKDLADECEAIKGYASAFLDHQYIGRLSEARGNLETIQAKVAPGRKVTWEIPKDRPLCTNWSDGEFERDGGGGHQIRAEISFAWEITPEAPAGGKPKCFVLEGLASTAVVIVERLEDGSERPLGRWTMDVGDEASPGCHFHVQVCHQDEPPFPKTLPVPRFPSMALSPFFAIDFVLGELFQDRWKTESAAGGNHADRWRVIQQSRLVRFLDWQIATLKRATGSPWMALKEAKPPLNLVVERAS